MKPQKLFLTLVTGIALFAVGCGRREGDKTALSPRLFNGRIMFIDEHYFEIENKSDHDLDDVNVSVTLFNVQGDSNSLKLHWAHWNKGEMKKVIARDAEGQAVDGLNGVAGEGSSSEFTFRFQIVPSEQF